MSKIATPISNRRKPKYLFEDLLDGNYIYVSTDTIADDDDHLRLYIGDDGETLTPLPVGGIKRLQGGAVVIQAARSRLCFVEPGGALERTVRPRWYSGKLREKPLRRMDPKLFEITEDLTGTIVRKRK